MVSLGAPCMTHKSESLQTLKLAIPIVFSQVAMVLFGVIDNIMVGPLGAVPLAGAAFINNIMSVPLVFLIGFSSAMSVLVSKSVGEKNYQQTGAWLFSGLISNLICTFLVLIILCGVYFYTDKMGQDPEVVAASKEYFIVMALSLIPALIFNSFKQFSEALSMPIGPLVVSYLALLLNAGFNWIFIFGHWGFPAYGLYGAGIGTLLARTLMCVGLMVYVLWNPKFKMYLVDWKVWGGFKARFVQIRKLGLPSGFQYLFEVGAFAGSGILMGWFGAKTLAAHQISLSMASLTFMVALGLSIASSVRVGESVGEKDILKARRIGKNSLWLAFGFMSICGLMFVVFGRALTEYYIDDTEVINIAVGFLMIVAVFQVFDGTQAVGVGILRGLSDVRVPTLITFVAYWVIALPMAYFLGFHTELGPRGIWISLAMGLGIASFALMFRFFKIAKK